MNHREIRVRFAPSPTGPLHIGGVRTALYNFLFARKQGGKVILRIEDTDQNRYVPGAEEYIINALDWCGISFDEDIGKGGPFGPYRQSERRDIYRQYAEQLVQKGFAYYAFDTEEELEAMRNRANQSDANASQYGPVTRMSMKNALTMTEGGVQERLDRGEPHVIRIRIPENETIHVKDLIRGDVEVLSANLDDKVLFKSDGWPTYHLANIVDDHLMEITHVIRGEEWLPSAPLHVLLYRCFGWEESMRQFAHLLLLLKPDGNGKLSKRDGDRLGFPVFPLEWKDPFSGEISHGYREDGYLPEAFINMLAFLGWNPETEQEIFSMDELVSSFSLERVGKHGSKFDPEKAKWYNHQYVQKMSDGELAEMLLRSAGGRWQEAEKGKAEKICALIKERVFLLSDLWKNAWFLFQEPVTYDEQAKARCWMPDTPSLVRDFAEDLIDLDPFDKDSVHILVRDFVKSKNIKMGLLMNPLRLLVVGSNQGPGMMDIAEILGKEEFLRRINKGIEVMRD